MPVAGTCAVMLKLAYGVLPAWRPTTESTRPVALNGVLEVSIMSDDTMVLVETLSTRRTQDAEVPPELPFDPDLGHVRRRQRPRRARERPAEGDRRGLYVVPLPVGVSVPVACAQIRSSCVETNRT